MKKELEDYFNLLADIHRKFGYVEDWGIFPMVDDRDAYWFIRANTSDIRSGGTVTFSYDPSFPEDAYYENEIYTYRHLTKYVYETEDYTMVLVDTHADNNIFLQILSNDKRVTEEKANELWERLP